MGEIIRQVSNQSGTVPAGVSGGLARVSTDAQRNDTLIYTPNGAPDLEELLPYGPKNKYIYIPATNVIARILSAERNIKLDRDLAGLANAPFEIVTADLSALSISNSGNDDGTVNGATFSSGDSWKLPDEERPLKAEINDYLEPLVFIAPSATVEFTITENK